MDIVGESETAKLIKTLVSIPSVNPASKQEDLPDDYYGEAKKAEFVKNYLKDIGITDIEEIQVKDDRVVEGYRPTIIATIPGEIRNKNELVVLGHLDVVPPGDLSQWTTPPFEPDVRDGKIYGRGSVDNLAAVAGMLVAAKEIMKKGITPKTDLKLVFAADEEAGSTYGMKHIMDNMNPFSDSAMAYVPDAGDNGRMVEIAEKGIIHLQFTYTGENSKGCAIDFENKLYDVLHEKYPDVSEGFRPDTSTFEPTVDETTGSPAPNAIPGVYSSKIRIENIPSNIDLKSYVQILADAFTDESNSDLKKADNDKNLKIEVKLKADVLTINYTGKECHGSMPDEGKNARLASVQFEHQLYEHLENKHIMATPITNEENTYWSKWDNRIVPNYTTDEVFETIKLVANTYSLERKVDIDITLQNYDTASETAQDSPIVKAVFDSYKRAGAKPEYMKIGGGTYAGLLRKYDIDSVAGGMTDDSVCHQIDEYVVIKDAKKESKVILDLVSHWGDYIPPEENVIEYNS